MKTEERIEQYLRAAPKPPASDSLMNKLRNDVSLRELGTRGSALRRWFAPSGGGISYWRVAAAAAIALIVLLPLSYGATKLLQRFITISQLPTVRLDFPYGGALSPDGSHFAGVTWDSELLVIDTAAGETRSLAKHCYGPAVWSADGKEIAVMTEGGSKRGLLAVSAQTGDTRSLMVMEDLPYLQDWAPDGRSILAVRTVKNKADVRSAVLIHLEDKEETVLVEETENWPSPRFSEDGDRVSYVSRRAGRSILHLQRLTGTTPAEYANFPGEISQPLWSPEGSHIIFVGTQRGLRRAYKDLWALRVDGDRFVGAPFPVVPDVEQMDFYNWSRNGQLAYRTGFQLGGILTLPVDLQTGTATGAPRSLVRKGGFGSHCWSPDGKQLALWEGGELVVLSAGSGEKVRSLPLPDMGGDLGYPGRGVSWSPDGRWIALSGLDRDKRAGVFLVAAETGTVRLLVALEERLPNFDPTWAPDSKTIAYGYKGDVYVVNIGEAQPRRITPPPEERVTKDACSRPVFAPDGGSVAYICGSKVLATTVDGQKTRQVFQLNSKDKPSLINIFDWSPDGRHIVFTPGNTEIWCAPTDGGAPFLIAVLPNPVDKPFAWMPKWSPTGDSIAFTVSHEKYQYWVMENFLPAAGAGRR